MADETKRADMKREDGAIRPEEVLLDGNLRALEALRAEAPDPDILGRLAAAYNARVNTNRAREAAEEGLALDPDHGDLWWERVRAASLGENDDMDAMAGRLLDVQQRHPEEAWSARNLGLVYYYLGEDELSAKWCEKALGLDEGDSRAHEVMAYRAYTLDDISGAIEHCAQAAELDPRNHRAYQWLGECYWVSDAPGPAERCFLQALEEEEYDFLALASLGEMYLQSEETLDLAVRCFSRILSVNPRNWTVYLRFIEYYLSAGHHLQAAAECHRLLALNPESRVRADAHQYLGLIHYLEGRDEEAEEALEAALEADPKFAPPYHYLGLVAERAGDTDHAEELFLKSIELDPEYAFSHVRLGYLYFDRGSQEQALRYFNRALEADPEEYMAHLGLSEVMRARDQHKEQLEHVLRAHEIAPTDGNVLNQLGIAHESMGDLASAGRAYRKALKAEPRNRHAANNLGYLLERRMEQEEDSEVRDRLQQEAVEAWRRRLLICRDEDLSIQGARSHLRKLDVPVRTVEEWLETGSVAEDDGDEEVH